MATVTLPGGTTKYSLNVGADASAALTSAIKSEFTAAGKNFTLNVVGSAAAGKAGFFSAVLDKSTVTANTSLTAGSSVQAIFDMGTGKDTLIGGTAATLLVGNANATKGDSFTVAGKTTVFGTAGADTLSVGAGANATSYLEGGANTVTLVGADTLTVAGTGTASITGGATGKEIVNVTGTGATTISAGAASISVTGGSGAVTFVHGKGGADTVNTAGASGTLTGAQGSTGSDVFNIGLVAGGKFVINSFSGGAAGTDKITITGATPSQISKALSTQATIKGGTVVTVGTEKITVLGGALTTKNFT